MNINHILKRKNTHNIIPASGNKELFVTELSYRRQLPSISTRATKKSYFCLHFILRGVHHVSSPTGEFDVPEGYAWARFPQELIRAYDSPDAPISYAYISFMGSQASALTERLGISPEQRVFAFDNDMRDILLAAVFDCKDNPEIRDFISNAALWDLFSALARRCAASAPKNKRLSGYIENALAYIDKHYDSCRLNATEVAEYLNLNTDYFLRLFKDAMKTSFSNYLISKRLNIAFGLVENRTDLSISDIAEAVGYSSSSYFTSAFHKAYGLSPMQYRQQKKNDE